MNSTLQVSLEQYSLIFLICMTLTMFSFTKLGAIDDIFSRMLLDNNNVEKSRDKKKSNLE